MEGGSLMFIAGDIGLASARGIIKQHPSDRVLWSTTDKFQACLQASGLGTICPA